MTKPKSKRKTKSVSMSTAKRKSAARSPNQSSVQTWLQLAQLRSEKCELKEAHVAYNMALEEAKSANDLRGVMEALAGLLRLASEALDEIGVRRWESELDRLMAQHPRHVPPMAWHCKGAISHDRNDIPLRTQRYFHRYLRAVRTASKLSAAYAFSPEEAEARAWLNLAITLWRRNHVRRCLWLTEHLLKRYENASIRSVRGLLYLLRGNISEKQRRLEDAMHWYQQAHTSFLADHNWYYHLYVLYGYARIARIEQNYVQAYWYLDLIDKAAPGPEFGQLRREIATERCRLQQDAVDLLIDSRQCVIKTRDGGEISLGKQYVLLHILEALSQAHGREGNDLERGLSKAEIIQRVWKEPYRPEAHDNKLYYNINRLRKLIEPDARNPQYLLNWKEGYRLAPGLRVHFVGGRNSMGEFRLNGNGGGNS